MVIIMLKGKSTIALFDAVSGRKTEEYSDENIVTNAFNNFFNFDEEIVMRGINPNSVLGPLTPLFPNYLKGILLWDSMIPENPDIVIAPAGVRCVGHAGTAYFGTKKTRGTYNENESEISKTGAKMVWDFPTDKGNGIIKAVSLTSIIGGNAGWMTEFESGNYTHARFYKNPNSPAATTPTTLIPNGVKESGGFQYVGELRRGIHTYISDRSDQNLTVLEMSYPKNNEIHIFMELGSMTKENTIENTFEIPWGSKPVNISNGWYIRDDNILVYTEITGNANVRVRYVNLINKTITSEKTFTLSENVAGSNPCAFYNNQLYANSTIKGGLSRFNDNGQFADVIMSPFSGNRFSRIGENLLLSSTSLNAGITSFLTDGVNYSVISSGDMSGALVPLASFGRPAYGAVDNISGTGGASLVFITPFLATINNLAAQVTKTSQNTMKVTYEISME